MSFNAASFANNIWSHSKLGCCLGQVVASGSSGVLSAATAGDCPSFQGTRRMKYEEAVEAGRKASCSHLAHLLDKLKISVANLRVRCYMRPLE